MARTVTYPDGVSIYELIFYTPCLLMSLFIVLKHGVKKSSGWIFLVTFCMIRIIGAAARVDTIWHPDSHDAYTVALVTSILGLSPLLMASLGLTSQS
jgi:prolipoprotein diacylglyceryltransferase